MHDADEPALAEEIQRKRARCRVPESERTIVAGWAGSTASVRRRGAQPPAVNNTGSSRGLL
ncbi:hypothetical protein Arub01_28760 [Actinomadura rubrobrunea]|uniref:Uncharacterized protein n=1 Tax=Actinomadura rubrobrunea TaxID=115335 RepID=A0A9W6PXQ1_9ACTN|nr:hypothetical protein Arub01_28760 [Actinomadura rubrobrunea]